MPSLRSRLLCFMMKNSHLFRLRLKREQIDWSSREAIEAFRIRCEDGARRFGKIPSDIEIIPTSIENIYAEWIVPDGAPEDRAILFMHGGGYVSGSCSDHAVHVAKIAKGSGIRALLFEYRLAPEHTFPAAVDDSVKAYQWLIEEGFSPSDIVFSGDSAGGGLVLATLLALKDRKIALPAAVVAISPWTDLTCSGKSYISNARKCLSPEGIWKAFSAHYSGENDPVNPLISPLYGDLEGLPPTLIHVGGDEILLDDARSYAARAEKAGVDISLRVGEGLFHCYPVCAPMFPEATEAMEEICSFIKSHNRHKQIR